MQHGGACRQGVVRLTDWRGAHMQWQFQVPCALSCSVPVRHGHNIYWESKCMPMSHKRFRKISGVAVCHQDRNSSGCSGRLNLNGIVWEYPARPYGHVSRENILLFDLYFLKDVRDKREGLEGRPKRRSYSLWQQDVDWFHLQLLRKDSWRVSFISLRVLLFNDECAYYPRAVLGKAIWMRVKKIFQYNLISYENTAKRNI